MYSRPSASQIRLPRARTKAMAGSTFRLSETTPPAMTSALRRKSSSDAARRGKASTVLPVPDAAIGIEGPLKKFLLKGVLPDFGFVDLDPESRSGRRPHRARLPIDLESFADDVVPPGHVRVDRLANHVGGRREPQLQRRGRADRALGVMGSQRHPVGFREGGDPPRLAQAAAMGNV